MLRVALQIEYADGSAVDVAATAADLMAFETNFDKPFTVFARRAAPDLFDVAGVACRQA